LKRFNAESIIEAGPIVKGQSALVLRANGRKMVRGQTVVAYYLVIQ
jgi:hypothetical protein